MILMVDIEHQCNVFKLIKEMFLKKIVLVDGLMVKIKNYQKLFINLVLKIGKKVWKKYVFSRIECVKVVKNEIFGSPVVTVSNSRTAFAFCECESGEKLIFSAPLRNVNQFFSTFSHSQNATTVLELRKISKRFNFSALSRIRNLELRKSLRIFATEINFSALWHIRKTLTAVLELKKNF